MRGRRLFPFLLALLLLVTGRAFATPETASPATPSATVPHLTVQLVVPPAQIYPGQHFTAGLYFKLEPGWHVYWTNAGDSGEPPSIRWALPDGVSAGDIQFPTPKRLPLGPLMDFGYENEVLFPIPVTVANSVKPAGSTASLGGKVSWLVCREVCIPGKAELAVTRAALGSAPSQPGQVADDAALITRFASTLPGPLPSGDQAKFETTPKGFTLAVSTGQKEESAQFFPFDQTIVSNPAPQTVTPRKDGVTLDLIKDENIAGTPKELHGLLVLSGGRSYEIHATPGALAVSTGGSTDSGLLGAALLAFVGGLILNLMPCVFPVLFIKGLSLVQSSSEERGRLRAHGFVYTLGILLSFWAVVAALLVLRGAGHQLGWGFQFQSPIFLALISLLLFFLGLSLAGQFEIGLTLTSAGGGLAQKSGYTGSFFTGILAVVVATPCAAPFMGTAIGYALAQPPVITFVVFTALALGLAAPYLLLTFVPSWAKLLPRPGAWMEVLKQAVSVPIFGTVIWLVWVFTQVTGPTALMALLAAFLLLAIAGWILGRWPAKAPATVAAVLVLALAIVVPVYAAKELGAPISGPASGSAATTAGATKWEPFTPQLVAQYRAQGKPVFVDFTASWCLSCQVNERVVLERTDVEQKLAQSGMALVKADWTQHDDAITQTLAALGRSSIPTYAIYPADPSQPAKVLPEVLTPGIVISAVDSVPKPDTQKAEAPATGEKVF
ncbi:protein-disulfide reductase DsbD family protein [Silvibacterium sp.]|uniref:protein-disulfide reductase DsbD family protein n=1 Tax=Silvibacterium sp. TaxID=1964179 RepID=UPI0039E581E9